MSSPTDFDRDSVRIHAPSHKYRAAIDESFFEAEEKHEATINESFFKTQGNHGATINESFFEAEGSGAGGKRPVYRTFSEHTSTHPDFPPSRVFTDADPFVTSSEKNSLKGKHLKEEAFNEETPLIQNNEPEDRRPDEHITWKRETKDIGRDTLPLILSALLECSLSTASIIAVGRLGTIELGAASVASMLANFTGYMIYYGLTSALDTLCVREFDNGMHHLVSVHFQRMLYLLLIVTVPIIVLWSFAEQILPRVLSDKEVASLAGRYLRIIAWGTPGFALFESGKRYIQAQGVYSASPYVLGVCAPVNAFLNWLLVWKCGLGFVGAPIALTITDWLLPCTLFLYVYFGSHDDCWNGFTRRALSNWGPMMRIATVNVAAVESESLVYGITTLASSYIGTRALAAQTVLVTVTNIIWQVPYSLSVSTRARVSNLLVLGLGDAAWKACKIATSVALGVGSLYIFLLSLLRYPIAKIFSRESEVIELVAQAMPLCAAAHFVECLVLGVSGILCGIGKQAEAGYLQTGMFAAIALPLQFGLAFGLGWSVWGLWIGALSGFCAILAAQCLFLYQTSWEKVVQQASESLSVD